MTDWQQLDYDDISRLLRSLGISGGAAESHGTLCGMLCAAGEVDSRGWLTELQRLDGAATAAAIEPRVLTELHDETVRRITDPECDFYLLIPSDDEPLEERTHALAQWCRGFLYGFGTAGKKRLSQLPEAVAEITHDLIEIAKVAPATRDGNGDEAAFAELVEYIRVGTLLIHAELQPARSAPGRGILH